MSRKFSQLSSITSLGASDKLVVQQGGVTKLATVQQMADAVPAVSANDILVFLSLGQSEQEQQPSQAWTPNQGAFAWNWSFTTGTVGTAFAQISTTTIARLSDRVASELVRLTNDTLIYMITIAKGGMDISHWMTGASSPDLYQDTLNNVVPALAILGKTTIDGVIWYQGTTQTSEPYKYVDDLETVMDRFFAQSWMPRRTPIYVVGLCPSVIGGTDTFPFQDTTNGALRKFVRRDQGNRRFIDTSRLDSSNWDGTVHPSGPGTLTIGTMIAEAIVGGDSNNTVEALTGLIRADAVPRIRNLLYGGGDFALNPWSRAQSFGSIASGQRLADGWQWYQVGSGVVNVDKTADAPTMAQSGYYTTHCLDVNVTSADGTIASTDVYALQTFIEGLDVKHLGFGQPGVRWLTVSFWVKATVTGNYPIAVRNSASTRGYAGYYVISTANTWEYKRITFPVDTGGTWLYDTGTGLVINFGLAVGNSATLVFGGSFTGYYNGGIFGGNPPASLANGVGSTGHFKLALVQVEEGPDASPFWSPPKRQLEQHCLRYYRKSFDIATLPAQNVGNHTAAVYAPSRAGAFGVRVSWDRMRTTPTITTYNPHGTNANWRDVTNSLDRTASVILTSDDGMVITGASGAADANNFIHYQADAELTFT